jgi:biopolymer transport protein ExbB
MSRTLRRHLPVLALLLVAPALVLVGAAEGDAPAAGPSLVALIFHWSMWPLDILSVISVSMAIQQMMLFTKERLMPEGLADDIHNLFAEGVSDEAVEQALNIAQGDRSMLGEVLAAALDKKEFGYDAMKSAAEAVTVAEHNKYITSVNWLNLFAAIATMFGLLGTVTGMIGAFFTMAARGGQVDAAVLADNIGSAMVTTAAGLMIAIPMLCVLFFLKARINKCVLDLSIASNEILDYFRGR